MKKVSLLFIAISLLFIACKNDQYSNLENGIYANIKTKYGDILLKLEYDKVPITVANFVSLAEGTNDFVEDKYKGKPFYDGLKFHRVMKNFMIQGGDPQGTGMGGPGYKFGDEFNATLKHDKPGILSMANSGPNTNGSQFFITHKATPWLNNIHTIFGEVIKGQEIVNKVVKGDIIEKVTIIRKGEKAIAFDADKIFSNGIVKMEEEAKKVAQEKKKKWGDILANEANAKMYASGLKKFIVKEGTGVIPKKGQKVTIHYSGYFRNGKMFDSSIKKGKPLTRAIGVGQLIQGWDEGVTKMKVGEKAILYIPSYLAYGTSGIKGVIPPNSDMIFELELLDVK